MKRLPTEGIKAYEAFKTYLDLGPQRTLNKVCKKLGKAHSLISKWSQRHKWQDRILAEAAEDDDRRVNAEEKAALEAARKREQRRLSIEDQSWDIAQKLFEKAKAMINFPIVQHRTVEERAPAGGLPEGAPVRTTIINPAGWRFGDVARIAEIADGLSRLSAGLPQRVSSVTDPSGGALPIGQGVPSTIVVQFDPKDDEGREERYERLATGDGRPSGSKAI